jgi:hypothetical protein
MVLGGGIVCVCGAGLVGMQEMEMWRYKTDVKIGMKILRLDGCGD